MTIAENPKVETATRTSYRVFTRPEQAVCTGMLHRMIPKPPVRSAVGRHGSASQLLDSGRMPNRYGPTMWYIMFHILSTSNHLHIWSNFSENWSPAVWAQFYWMGICYTCFTPTSSPSTPCDARFELDLLAVCAAWSRNTLPGTNSFAPKDRPYSKRNAVS